MNVSHDQVQAFVIEEQKEDRTPSRQDRSSEWLGNFADEDDDSNKS